MNKKFISLIMAALLAVSASAVSVSAAVTEEETAGAEVTAEVSGDSKGTFFFDCGDWNSESLLFYIWDADTNEYAAKKGWLEDSKWGSRKNLSGTEVDGNPGLFESYEVDFTGREDHKIFVVFNDYYNAAIQQPDVLPIIITNIRLELQKIVGNTAQSTMEELMVYGEQ